MRVGIVGCGLMGARRSTVISASGDEVPIVADIDAERAVGVAAACGAEWTRDWHKLVERDDLDAIVVATPNDQSVKVSVAALSAGIHVLCEKPLGRNAKEAESIVNAARASGRVLKVGFNHRHHPAIQEARRLVEDGAIGDAMGVRAAYGHGGRFGYEREWRADATISGGGELLDQGVHLIDLSRWFLGEFSAVSGMVATWHWPIEPVEDNVFALMQTAHGRIASITASWTEWRNTFRFEVMGGDGYLRVDGLGGNYGPERLTVGIRPASYGRPDEREVVFDERGESWALEWREFRTAVAEKRQPLGSGEDGLAAARIVDAIYRSARSAELVNLEAER
jgi:predicted dehydrogenase